MNRLDAANTADHESSPLAACLNVISGRSTLAARIYGDIGKVVLLLHGGPGCPDYLEPVARLLSSRFRAVTFDQRGVGASTAVGHFGIQDYVADIEAIRLSLGVETMHVFGHSWGGLLAQLYASDYPTRVDSVFLANSAAGVGEHWSQTEREVLAYNRRQSGLGGFAVMGMWAVVARLPGRAGNAALRRMFARVWQNYFPDPTTAPPADSKWLAGAHSVAVFRTTAAVRTAKSSVLDGLGSRLDVPVLVVYGDADIYGPSINYIRTRFPRADHIIIDQCGHLPWLQAPDRFAALLHEFYEAGVAG